MMPSSESLSFNVYPYAIKVICDCLIKGPVSGSRQLDSDTREIYILKQTVRVDSDTIWNGTDGNTVQFDDIIEVSGHLGDDGSISATYISLKGPTINYTVKGLVEALDPMSATFKINDLTLDYKDAVVIGLPADFRDIYQGFELFDK